MAGMHHDDAVAVVRCQAEVVGDEQGRHLILLGAILDQVHDAGLGRHIQPGGRLVRHQQGRLASQRQRDHHALAHAARELKRVGVITPLGVRNVDLP